MIFVYGSYRSSPNEFTPRWMERIEKSDSGQPVKRIVQCTIEGWKIGDPASITSQMSALRAGISSDGRNFSILDDLNRPTIFQLPNDGALGGVRVTEPPHIPSAEGADYATRVGYRFSLEAEYLANPDDEGGDEQSGTFNFTESVEVEGGGPLIISMLTTAGPPVIQTVAQRTPFVARQSGSFSSYLPTVQVPRPRWPAARVDTRRPRITQSIDGGGPVYQYSWDYDFLSIAPLQ